jgi:hypothetical protein
MKIYLFLGALSFSMPLFSQVGINTETPKATLDVVGKPTEPTALDGILAPRLTGDELAAKTYTTAQTGAIIYATASAASLSGQVVNVDAAGYYYFDGSVWRVFTGSGPSSTPDINIYKDNGTLTSDRTVTQDGKFLRFSNIQNTTFNNGSGGLVQSSGSGSRASIGLTNNGASQFQLYSDTNSATQMYALGASTALNIGTHLNSGSAAPIRFITSAGGGAAGNEKMIITGGGNVGISSNTPTERFDVSGIARFRSLPLNGAANSIYTTPGGTASTTQNQTFTAARTVVADANGVLGYVEGVPTDAGTSKVLVLANAPGTQNVQGQFIPNAAIGQFTNEGLDIHDAWTNNVFTVPSGMDGVYIIVMQNSNRHTSTGTATPTWHTAAYYERSTDGGTSWSTMIKHTYSDLAGTIVDNGNTLYWTGFLNSGDRVRVRFSCNATTNNIVDYGGISITKLAQ